MSKRENIFKSEPPKYFIGKLYSANHAANMFDYAYKEKNLIISASILSELNKVEALVNNDDLRKQYNIMSVPCLVINETEVSFGKKNINQLLDILLK